MERKPVVAGERLARVETQIEAVLMSLARGREEFREMREAVGDLHHELQDIVKLLAQGATKGDLAAMDRELEERVKEIEKKTSRLTFLTGILGSVVTGIVGFIMFFGPDRISAGWRALWRGGIQ